MWTMIKITTRKHCIVVPIPKWEHLELNAMHELHIISVTEFAPIHADFNWNQTIASRGLCVSSYKIWHTFNMLANISVIVS